MIFILWSRTVVVAAQETRLLVRFSAFSAFALRSLAACKQLTINTVLLVSKTGAISLEIAFSADQ